MSEPFWPTDKYYCEAPSTSRAGVLLRFQDVQYAELMSQHIEYLWTTGRLSQGWRLVLVPHIAGAEETTFVLEPRTPVAPMQLETDLRTIGEDLGRQLADLARRRLFRFHDAAGNGCEMVALSNREREVLELFLSGLGAASIAQRLFISPYTVRNHLKHICAKYQVTSQQQLRELFVRSS